jgi:hypothetical protein
LLSPGSTIREAWELYKAHWQHLLPFALVVYLILGVVSLLLALLLGWFGALLGSLIGIVGLFWLQGALVEAVADIRDGRADMTMGETFARVQPHLWRLVGAGLLAGLAIAVGLLLLIVPGLYLMTIWSVIIPVIVLERASVMESFGRSRELVSGNGWNAFFVILLSFLILLAAAIVIGIATFWLTGAFGAFIRNVISNTITAPFVALAWTVMYYRLLEIKQPAAAAAPAAPPAPAAPAEPAAPAAEEQPPPPPAAPPA